LWLSVFLLLLAAVSCWKVEPDLAVSTNSVNFDSFIDSIEVQVRNDSEDNALTTGVDVLNYQLKCDKPWVSVSPASGTCGEMEKHGHLVIVDRSLMELGENTATISVTSNGGSATINVRAIRTVPGCSDKADVPHTPQPAMAATGVPVDTELSFEGGDSRCSGLTATYDVYFGATTPPPFHHTDSLKVWSPGPLANNTIYYWRIVAKDANGSSGGPEWRFRTVCVLGPSDVTLLAPANNATNVSVVENLTWRGGESRCAGLSATYDLYFGTTNPPPFHHTTSVKSWYAGIMTKGTTYYWRVVASDENGSDSSPVWSFTTVPQPCTTLPSAVTLESPAQGATDVPVSQDLSWSGGNSRCEGMSATYDVYFGDETPPPLDHNNGSSKTWDPGTLEYDTIYYWRVVARDASGSTTSSERWFRTPCSLDPGSLTLVSPADNATGVALDVNLLWGGGNSRCPGLSSTYDVYFGTSSPPPFHHNNGGTKNWDPGTLSLGTKYYWRIVAKDANGTTSGPEWDFITVCNTLPGAPCSPSPSNAAINVSREQNLAWGCGNSNCGLPVTYDVYLGRSPNLDEDDKLGSISSKSWTLPRLSALTTYYWKIVVKDANGTTSGPVWTFVTRS